MIDLAPDFREFSEYPEKTSVSLLDWDKLEKLLLDFEMFLEFICFTVTSYLSVDVVHAVLE